MEEGVRLHVTLKNKNNDDSAEFSGVGGEAKTLRLFAADDMPPSQPVGHFPGLFRSPSATENQHLARLSPYLSDAVIPPSRPDFLQPQRTNRTRGHTSWLEPRPEQSHRRRRRARPSASAPPPRSTDRLAMPAAGFPAKGAAVFSRQRPRRTGDRPRGERAGR